MFWVKYIRNWRKNLSLTPLGKLQLVLADHVTEHLCHLWVCNYRICNFICIEEGYFSSQQCEYLVPVQQLRTEEWALRPSTFFCYKLCKPCVSFWVLFNPVPSMVLVGYPNNFCSVGWEAEFQSVEQAGRLQEIRWKSVQTIQVLFGYDLLYFTGCALFNFIDCAVFNFVG